MTPRERWLLEVARDVRRHLVNRVEGRTYLGGKHDEVFLARRLTIVLALYEDVEPVHDLDRHDRKAIVLTDALRSW